MSAGGEGAKGCGLMLCCADIKWSSTSSSARPMPVLADTAEGPSYLAGLPWLTELSRTESLYLLWVLLGFMVCFGCCWVV
jgi:hypothetical protein